MTTQYEPRTWVDGDTGGTALSAANLNHIEQGVAAASAAAADRAPAVHTHSIDSVSGLRGELDGKAPATHSHPIAQVTGLQPALDGKAPTDHGHTVEQITGLQSELSGRAPTVHSHPIAQVTGLQPALDGKAPSSHTHPITQVDGLGTALAAKAAASHTHPMGQVDGLTAALAAKADLVPDGQGGMVIPTANIPAKALNTTKVVGSEAEMLALTPVQVQEGDLAKRTDLGGVTFALGPEHPSVLSSWIQISSTGGAVDSVNGQVGVVVLGRGDVGLGQVDNTPDAAKPVSGPQATALAGKAPTVHTHTIAQVDGLQDALDAKAPMQIEYVHPVWDIPAVTSVEAIAREGDLLTARAHRAVRGGDGPPPEDLQVQGGDVWIDFTTGKHYEYEEELS
ncbi:hypothetical protein P9990_17480 [Prescottella equi]|uniref:hypothetical protein n=1 Tax=Rhodococcus hoagii TaxID=43767 RepID=UPI002574E26F|nr:hypothetical protein [Prescottella equi]WJJ10363.1 hypothetical protein P9990_17480 [Prescottella equi]